MALPERLHPACVWRIGARDRPTCGRPAPVRRFAWPGRRLRPLRHGPHRGTPARAPGSGLLLGRPLPRSHRYAALDCGDWSLPRRGAAHRDGRRRRGIRPGHLCGRPGPTLAKRVPAVLRPAVRRRRAGGGRPCGGAVEVTLLIAVFLPLAVATVIGRIPTPYLRAAALLATGLDLGGGLGVLQAPAGGAPLSLNVEWAGPAGLGLRLSADGVSATLLALNALVGLMAVLATRISELKGPHLFLAMPLAAQTAVAGAFLARDLVLFFVFYEAVLLPVFILIAVFGEGRGQYVALKLLVFTSAGSLAMLVSILAIFVASGGSGSSSFAFGQLTRVHFSGGAVVLGLGAADLVFLGFTLAFAIKTPLFPFHGWLAEAYTSAPTPVVMLLAGVVSKLGPYGFFRIALPLLPSAAQRFSPLLMTLAAVGIVYAALLALRQEDTKRMVAYLSLSHMCFISLGIFSLTSAGISGGVLQMLNHGILITSLFF